MNIPIIKTNDILIGDLNISLIPIDNVFNGIPPVQTFSPPVTVNLGTPIVDIPGCVEAHETNNPKNNQIKSDDERGLVTYCDSSLPSFNPIQYEPEQIIPTRPSTVDTRDVPKKETPSPSPTIEPPSKPEAVTINCPTPIQESKEPVGSYVNGYRQKVVGYELIGRECIRITEDVGIPEQIISGLPSGGQVIQVGGIAVVATASALMAKPLADILLKVVKPTVKKVMKKIAAIRGKSVPVLSVRERREEQRDRNQVIANLRSVKAKTKR